MGNDDVVSGLTALTALMISDCREETVNTKPACRSHVNFSIHYDGNREFHRATWIITRFPIACVEQLGNIAGVVST